jgi:hypothetical protein
MAFFKRPWPLTPILRNGKAVLLPAVQENVLFPKTLLGLDGTGWT